MTNEKWYWHGKAFRLICRLIAIGTAIYGIHTKDIECICISVLLTLVVAQDFDTEEAMTLKSHLPEGCLR